MTRRGAVHILDAFLASLIIATALLYSFQVPLGDIPTETQGLSATGYQVILSLDGNSSLGTLLLSEDWNSIEELLNIALPSGVSYNLTVLDENGFIVNTHPISNGGLKGQNIESVEYLLAVESGGCPIYRLRLQMGR